MSLEVAEKPRQTAESIVVILKHRDFEQTLTGDPESILREITSYFSRLYPKLEILARLTLSIDDSEFLQSCAGVLAATSEGVAILKDVDKLRDKDLLALQLAGARLLYLLKRKDADAMSLEELTRVTGKPTGTVAGRMNELGKDQLVDRVGKGEYRLTTMGVRAFMRTLIPKLSEFPDR